jgi:hypothetical protein
VSRHRRLTVGARVQAWHTNGVIAPFGEQVSDVTSVRVSLPGLNWLHRIDIDRGTAGVVITVPPADGDSPTRPRLRIDPDLSITTRT